jgi:hypothetical protein
VPDEISITHWLQNLQTGNPDAPQELWALFFQQLFRLARRQLPAHLTGRFEAVVGSDAENNLDHDAESLRTSLPEEVGEEEFRAYMHWKAEKAEAEYAQEQADELIEEYEKGQDDK